MPRKPDINKKERYNDPFPSALRGLVKDNNTTQEDLKTVLNVNNRQSVTGYIDGNTLPTIDKLVALAKYYNVSTDYLLGLSGDVKSPNTEIQAICKYTGLSEESITALNHIQDAEGKRFLDSFILSNSLSEIFFRLIQAQSCNFVETLHQKTVGIENGTDEKTIMVTVSLDPVLSQDSVILKAKDACEYYKDQAVKSFSAFLDEYIPDATVNLRLKDDDQNTEK